MPRSIGLINIITHLHREPGIDREEHEALFDAAYEARRELKKHFQLEGLKLLIDQQLGVMSLVVATPEEIAQIAEDNEIEEFRPIYTSRSEDWWNSILLTILRIRYDAAIANPQAAWVSEDDLLEEYMDYQDDERRENSGDVREQMVRKLTELTKRRFVTMETPSGRPPHYAATKWLVIRLTDSVLDEMTKTLEAARTSDEGVETVEQAEIAAFADIADDLFNEARGPITNPLDVEDSDEFIRKFSE